jgi:DNA-binding transcriptional regulator YiaG
MFHYTACGLPNIWLANGFTETFAEDGAAFFNITGIRELHTVIAHNLTEKESPLTGAELRFLRSELKMSRKTLGDLIGYSDEAIKKWESDTNPLPKLADASVRKLFLELQHENGELRKLLMQIKNLERQERKLCFTETLQGWKAEGQQCA